ncbi:hypothetical protein M501DRAFT_103939 [Patellaria atrata CBS 101060]|uniref:Cation diffusion facilitator 1 n=1 Tax=Patellaria atrata CBS 101060 TaxID=1346257 RepID=A0A9P4VX94_9PEZI|nr:hypothetical protein M501DRAFT_103939 [Patellaria atrata CBS 101060]
MTSNSELRDAISMRPLAFHSDNSRFETPPPTSSERQIGATTAFEPTTPTEGDHDPIARLPTRLTGQSDPERQSLPQYSAANDPYELSSKIKTPDELQAIKANIARKREGCSRISQGKDNWKARKIHEFYDNQNENIERLLKPVDEHVREAKDQQGDTHLKFKIAVNGSFAANVILAILQLYGAISSGSLSILTTMVDSVFDPLSNLMLILSNRAVNRVDPRKFPSGKARIETAGNILFCFLMVAVSMIIICFSVKDLVDGSKTETKGFHLPAVIAVTIAFTTKFALFLYCWSLRNTYSQVRILWEDHRNDLLINGFGLLTSVGGSKLKWWIDPLGAVILSLTIIGLWLHTAYSEFQLLIGKSADTQMLQLITYISMTHSPFVRAIDTVRSWHSGPRLIVEVDIVMDPDETLRATHDCAEELQMKLERLPHVERAYVHVDYETEHSPEHFWKKDL